MQFIYHINSGEQTLIIKNELYKYLFGVRRHKKINNLNFRNMNDDKIYNYNIKSITKNSASLSLVSSQILVIEPKNKLHIAWCVIDAKDIEKQIPSLNELGVTKITFITCEYSQKKYKINFAKLNKILINSSQQSGRSNIIIIDICQSISNFLKLYPDTYLFNFSNNHINNNKNQIKTILIGCEGGFTNSEISHFEKSKIVGINSNLILQSKTAVIAVASNLLL